MASRSIKRVRRMRMASRSGSGSGSGIVLSQNLAGKFRKEVEEGKESAAGLHLVVSGWVRNQGHRLFVNSCYDQEWSCQRSLWSPFPKLTPGLIGSCNGLLCFATNESVVWEPSTNKLQLVPGSGSMTRPCVCSDTKCVRTAFSMGGGLHFDSHNGDYKLFSFITAYYDYNDEDGFSSGIFHHYLSIVEVYSVKNNAWKELSYPLSEVEGKEGRHPVEGQGEGICVDGVCYWHGTCLGDYSFILAYNFVTEEFSSFRRPSIRQCSKLVEMDGSPCLLFYHGYSSDQGKIWLKKADTHSSSSPEWSDVDGLEVDVGPYEKPLWFGKRNGGYHLLLEGPQGHLREYDYTRKRFRRIPVMTSPANKDHHKLGSICYRTFAYETKTKNSADIWHSSSFHELEIQKRFAVLAAGECDQERFAVLSCDPEQDYC